MKIAIRIEVTTDYGETETFELFKLERPYRQGNRIKRPAFQALEPDSVHRIRP